MRITLEVLAGPERGRTFSFDGPRSVVFGRGPDADVRLEAPGVSREHFRIDVTAIGCSVSDLDSKNGLTVNGVRCSGLDPEAPSSVALSDGSRLSVADVLLGVSLVPLRIRCAECSRDVTEEAAGRKNYLCAECRARGGATLLIRHALAPLPAVDGYTAEVMLNAGAISTVFRAREVTSDERVVIKMFRASNEAQREALAMSFKRQVRVIGQLTHENIVRCKGNGVHDGQPFLVLEWVDGPDLRQHLDEEGKLEFDTFGPLMLAMLEGLAHAHAASVESELESGDVVRLNGVVHRDLRPENVLLAPSAHGFVPKLTDFELAKTFRAAGMSAATRDSSFAGTWNYAPLEQFSHYRYLGPPSDVFSMAAVFYEALVGERIRPEVEAAERMARGKGRGLRVQDLHETVKRNPVVPLRERDAAIPGAVAAVIDRALREIPPPRDPGAMRALLAEVRYPDAAAFRDALKAALPP